MTITRLLRGQQPYEAKHRASCMIGNQPNLLNMSSWFMFIFTEGLTLMSSTLGQICG